MLSRLLYNETLEFSILFQWHMLRNPGPVSEFRILDIYTKLIKKTGDPVESPVRLLPAAVSVWAPVRQVDSAGVLSSSWRYR
jgi:hypothetical protein